MKQPPFFFYRIAVGLRQDDATGLFFNYLFAIAAFLTVGTLEAPRGSQMRRIERLLIGRLKLVAAIFALVSSHADLEP